MNACHLSRLFVLSLIAVGLWNMRIAHAESNWPGWRGPEANGHSREAGLPHQWTKESVTWKIKLVGRGHSSPTIWGQRIFLSSALHDGQQRIVMCIDRNDGNLVWQQTAWTGQPEPVHRMNSWASASCATDGHRVYAFFGRGGGLHCYTVDGKLVWSRDLGPFAGPWGTAASPLLVGNMVVQNCDAQEDAYIIALDKETGEPLWRTDRPDHRGWSSPILVRTAERDEIVVNGHAGVSAYDPATGKLLWFCQCPRGRGTPTVTAADGLVLAVNGLSGGGVYCVAPGGDGDVTESMRLWFTDRRARDLPSPIVIGETLLVATLRGSIVTAYALQDGKELWRKRIGGQVFSSPTVYDGLAFFINEAGETTVIDPTSESKIVANNTVGAADDEIFRASITPRDGQVFLRSDQYLYCVGSRRE